MLANWKILAISCLIAGIGLFQTAPLAMAQAGDVNPAQASGLDAPAAVDTDATNFQKATSMSGVGTQIVGGGHITVDLMTIRCPKGHCRIEVTAYMQVRSQTDGNDVSVCIFVAGSTTCPYAARLQIADNYLGLTRVYSVYDVEKGNYDIGLQIYSDYGIEYERYTVNAKSFTRKP